MASKSKKAAIEAVIAAVQAQGVDKIEAQSAAVPRPKGRTFDGLIVWVDCPLYPATEDSPQLRVGFRVDVPWKAVHEIHHTDPEIEGAMKFSQVARKWQGWDFLDALGNPIPVPNPDDIATYVAMGEYARDLVLWLPEGYKAAMEKRLESVLGKNGVGVSLQPSIN